MRYHSVGVIGGGFSGMAAAVELVSLGCSVTLIEQRRMLGGRASSFLDKTSGLWLDNGQHLMMGCYRQTFQFLKQIGAYHKIQFQKNLRVDFRDNLGQDSSLACLPLPAPFHLISGLVRLRHLPWPDRLGFHKIRIAPALENSKQLSAAVWLRGLGQSDQAIRNFWNILVLSIFNEPVDSAPAALLWNVLQEAFFSSRRDSVLAIPIVDLGHLCDSEVKALIEAHGGKVLMGQCVKRLRIAGNRVEGLECHNGQEFALDAYVSAVPPRALDRLIPDMSSEAFSHRVASNTFSASPILSVYLWYDDPVLDRPFMALLDSPIHWVFQKKGFVSLVISGARDYLPWPEKKIVDLAIAELHRFFPHTRPRHCQHHRVIKERHATYHPVSGDQSLRPSTVTPIENLFLAGDWTGTGLPCTIEGAVRSGHRAAQILSGEKGTGYDISF